VCTLLATGVTIHCTIMNVFLEFFQSIDHVRFKALSTLI
jgi:hypothetical protein